MRKDDRVPTLSSADEDNVLSQLSWFKLENLKRANIMVAGCGALGNEVLKNLALFGIEHMVIVDFDTVEPSNLTRSVLFNRDDAGRRRKKVEAAADSLRKINPDIKILPVYGNICHDIGLGLLRRMDAVAGCVDNRWARYCLNRLCMRAGVPWADGGIDALEGTARVFAPGKNCYACNLGPEALKDMSYRLSCSSVIRRNEQAGRVPTTPVVASIIGAVEAQEVIKLLHKEELQRGELTSLCGKMFYYEGQHLSSRVMEFIGYDSDCPVHEFWNPVEKTDITTDRTCGELMDLVSERFGSRNVNISLGDRRFVDYIVVKNDDRKIPVMLPDHAVERFTEEEPSLRHLPLHAMYQHEYGTIDSDFPYPDLTLKQAGIPPWEILQVTTEKGISYIELADELDFSKHLYQGRQE